MGVYIDMEMPKSCACCEVACKYYLDHGLDGLLAKMCHAESRLPDCPLVPVPPHGRLIDADALEELVIKQKYDCAEASAHGAITELHKSRGLHDAELMIEAAPTIILASEVSE